MITFPIGFYKGASGGSFENVYSIDFDGVDDYTVGDDSSLPSGNSAFTVSAWVNFDSIVQYATIVGYGTAASNKAVIINIKNQKLKASFYGTEFEPNATTLSTGQWYHVALTYDGSGTAKLYLDGSEEGSKTSLSLNVTLTGQINFGRWVGNTFYTDGKIDEVSVFSAELSASDISSIYNSGVPTDLSGESNLVAWYRMGDGANYPIIKNQVNFSQASLDFDGVNDYVDCGNASALNFERTDPFSLSVWVKPSNVTNYRMLVTKKGVNGTDPGYQWFMLGDIMYFDFVHSFTGNKYIRVTKSFAYNWNVGTWYHFVVTYDGSSNASGVNFYRDGSQLSSLTTVMDGLDDSTTNSTSVTLGSRQNQLYFAGNMDDVAVFNSELSASDVTSIYNSGYPKDESSTSNLVGYWKMGDGATYPTIPDDSSNSNDGTMTNMASDDIEAAKGAATMTNMASDDIVEDVPS